MKVGEFIDKYDLMMVQSSYNQKLLRRNWDQEILAFIVSEVPGSGGKMYAEMFAFIFQGHRKLFGVVNGAMRSPERAYKIITKTKLRRYDSKTAQRKIFMESM